MTTRRNSAPRIRAFAFILALSLLVPAASGIAATTEAGAVPKTIVGAWSRNITKATWIKYGQGHYGFPVGLWTMVIKKGGRVDYYTPGLYKPGCTTNGTCAPDSSTSFAFAGSRLTIASAPPCGAYKGTYAWKVTGRSLTFRVISDPNCTPRQALMSGVWKRT